MPSAPKKMLILAILEILRQKTDAEHRMYQVDIINELMRQYGISATRKTVRQSITTLLESGYPIEYRNGWYYEHSFCYAELNVIIDSIRFNTAIPNKQAEYLIDRIKALGGDCFKSDALASQNKPRNPEFMYTYEILHDAIDKAKQITFHYNDFDVDKQMHPRLDEKGEEKQYRASPYRIIQSNGRSYLICNIEKYDEITHFRVDRMTDARICDYPARSIYSLPGYSQGLDVGTYAGKHLHMFSFEAAYHRLECSRGICGDVLDWFGMDVQFDHITDKSFHVCVLTDAVSLKYWLLMYGEYAREV